MHTKNILPDVANRSRWLIPVVLPLLVFLSCFFIMKFYGRNSVLSNIVLLDLLITAPALYLIAIRKTTVSKMTTLRVFVAGVFMAGLLINKQSNPALAIISKWIAPLIELLFIYFVVKKFYTANRNAKAGQHHDFLIHCRHVIVEVTGYEKAGSLLASEIAVLYYAFFSRRYKKAGFETTFTGYKTNGLPLILWTIISILMIETIGMHFLFVLWNPVVAWILTAASFYTCLQLFAHIRAIAARPIVMRQNLLEVRNGLAGDAIIYFANIDRIELSARYPSQINTVKISLLKNFESHNIVIYLKEPITVTKVFGIKKKADVILFYVDDRLLFLEKMRSVLPVNIDP